MFDETGRLMADQFWRADMDGVDWPQVLGRYRRLVGRARTPDDLVDILWETVAELNTSHAYIAARPTGDPQRRTGFLGADIRWTEQGAVIERVLPSETSDPLAWCPLRVAGVDAQPGDVIVAVDGRDVGAAGCLGATLEGAVGQPVELTLRRGQALRRVSVVPVASEYPLRYHDWVASRVAHTAQRSQGRLGYVHVPDMAAPGWAEFHRLIERASQHEGVIVDVRENGGGHVSQLVAERLMRRVIGWDHARGYASDTTYPAQAMRGPVIVVTNRWAGSDGDIIAAVGQSMGLTVVGERSWGGVIGIDSAFDLIDGLGVTQPKYAYWIANYGWGVENHGVDPDIEVVMSPADWQSGEDPQLDTAIQLALDRLRDQPAATAPDLPPARFG
jgi:tricorn protease